MRPGPVKTILLVDDDELVREFTARCLTKANFTVILAANGEAAIEIFAHRRNEIDLVITDMVMPKLFGDQLALRLWETDPSLPVVFISGNPPEALEPGVTLEPGKNYLRKPFLVQDLLDLIKSHLSPVTR
jgi:two-component system, cell cycle sensor histidine kinase and response regulator CckA